MNVLKLILEVVLNHSHRKLKVTSKEIKNSWDRGLLSNSNSNSKKLSENSKLSKLKLLKSSKKDNRNKLELFSSNNKNVNSNNNKLEKPLRN